jgi:hypothetical protein
LGSGSRNQAAAVSPLDRSGVLLKLEKDLMKGKARWLANFNESFENYRVNDVTFDIFIHGNTRVKGFLLSRFFSYVANPNYEVGCYLYASERRLNRNISRKIVLTTKSSMDANEMKWCWLIMIADQIDSEAKDLVEKISDQGLAVVAVESDTGMITNSKNFLGRQARKFVKV